jgi:hypothetical protein
MWRIRIAPKSFPTFRTWKSLYLSFSSKRGGEVQTNETQGNPLQIVPTQLEEDFLFMALNVLPTAFCTMVIAPMVTRCELVARFHIVFGPAELRALHCARLWHNISWFVSRRHRWASFSKFPILESLAPVCNTPADLSRTWVPSQDLGVEPRNNRITKKRYWFRYVLKSEATIELLENVKLTYKLSTVPILKTENLF